MPRHLHTIQDADGRDVPGVSSTFWSRGKGHPKRTRYYVQGTKPIHWLGFDKAEAIRRFKAWRSRQTKETVALDPGREAAKRTGIPELAYLERLE